MSANVNSEEVDLIDSLVKEDLLSKNTAKKLKAGKNIVKPLQAAYKWLLASGLLMILGIVSRAGYYALWDGFFKELCFGLAWGCAVICIVMFMIGIDKWPND